MIPHFASKVKFVFAVECKGFGNCLNQDFQDEIGESWEWDLTPTASIFGQARDLPLQDVHIFI
ncbi:hypothetical protein C6500_05740 [Candidatus Poribacteria bacterium]|nr:MAG: hypothetical protein C6500_05740 [Candidatus Poribacteria bacterium]